ncbi:glycosyl hydrolase family 43 [Mesorhizobium sp. WSM4884]|uniref:glucosamine inositolphosphorylceramide transferase family protein n=1 Tax=Mesorhizobium sp. WSM4884 TaxID=3038542 RepID=UPI0024159B72|nr:glycosyl hydrolase family 43 [Mesorhizobium sp. WSM4884]MDG4883113.1 glycosyl hydrolase family 43 [Mesorhizobium sp. WSM4884]
MVDIWQVGIVPESIGNALAPHGLDKSRVVWLPPQGSFRFVADPFGLFHGDRFTLMVEAYDYRVKRGEIHYYSYDRDWTLLERGAALKERFHLSYPFLIRQGEDIFMLPEAYQSGRLTLYKATEFPKAWQPVAVLLDEPAVDATILRHQQRWWMLYALHGPDGQDTRELHAAFADSLTGPWRKHPQNPVRTGRASSRPAGSAFEHEGQLHLPTQDCEAGYGTAINLLRIERLTPEEFSAGIVKRLAPEEWLDGFDTGLHTLSDGGGVTLIDVRRVERSPTRHLIKLQYWLRRRLVAMPS